MISVTERENNNAHLQIEGELTIYCAEQFGKQMENHVKKYHDIEVDMAGVSEIDTSCYQVLLRAKLISENENKGFTIDKISDEAKQVFNLYNLNDLLKIA